MEVEYYIVIITGRIFLYEYGIYTTGIASTPSFILRVDAHGYVITSGQDALFADALQLY